MGLPGAVIHSANRFVNIFAFGRNSSGLLSEHHSNCDRAVHSCRHSLIGRWGGWEGLIATLRRIAAHCVRVAPDPTRPQCTPTNRFVSLTVSGAPCTPRSRMRRSIMRLNNSANIYIRAMVPATSHRPDGRDASAATPLCVKQSRSTHAQHTRRDPRTHGAVPCNQRGCLSALSMQRRAAMRARPVIRSCMLPERRLHCNCSANQRSDQISMRPCWIVSASNWCML